MPACGRDDLAGTENLYYISSRFQLINHMKRILTLAACVLAFVSCSTTRYLSPVTERPVSDIALITPLAVISYTDAAKITAPDDELSQNAEAMLATAVMRSALPVTRRLDADFFGSDSDMREDVMGLTQYNMRKKGHYPIPASIDRFLERHGQRYGLVIFSEGFTRDKKGYRKDVIKGAAIGVLSAVLSGGTTYIAGTPVKFRSDIYLAVYDSQMNIVVFFDRDIPEEADPFNSEQLLRRINRMADGIR